MSELNQTELLDMAAIALTPDIGKRDSAPTSMLAEAIAYAGRGWLVVPLHTPTPDGCTCGKPACASRGKHPRTRNGLKEGTTEPGQITRWWVQWPEANIGILTGSESKLCVLDVDGEEGRRALTGLTTREDLPKTLTAFTGRTDACGNRTGLHLYFRYPVAEHLRNTAGRLGKGLDTRGAGGYVVAPPSLHASGLRYRWYSGEVEIADTPSWLTKSSMPIGGSPANMIGEGRRNSTLTSLAGAMRKQGSSQAAIESALLVDNLRRCSHPLSEEEVRRIAASVSQYTPGEQTAKLAPRRRPDLVRLSDVAPMPVSWLWEPYLPLEMITVLSGDPGVGKTFISLAIAADLTQGVALLNRKGASPANVLYLTLENSPAHVLRPRFDAQGGDASRFVVMRGTLYEDGDMEKQGGFSLADVDQLESAIVETQARLVVIDPLQSFIGSAVDLHRSNETRPVLDGIIKLAERHKCAVLIVRHLSKAQGGRTLYRGLGSIDISGAARSELFVALHPNDADCRVMAHAKSNLGELGQSLTYAIGEDGRLVWGDVIDLTADDLLVTQSTGKQQSAVDDAADFLHEALSGGPQSSKDIQQQAAVKGISCATLRRAQDRLGVIKHPNGFGQSWMLELRRVAHSSAELLNIQR